MKEDIVERWLADLTVERIKERLVESEMLGEGVTGLLICEKYTSPRIDYISLFEKPFAPHTLSVKEQLNQRIDNKDIHLYVNRDVGDFKVFVYLDKHEPLFSTSHCTLF